MPEGWHTVTTPGGSVGPCRFSGGAFPWLLSHGLGRCQVERGVPGDFARDLGTFTPRLWRMFLFMF